MKKEKIEYFRNMLQQWLEELRSEAGGTVKDMSGKGSTFPDPVDRASLESDRNFELRVRDRERKLMAKIQEALQRIEEGEFGICEECGCEISEGRLEARPVTTLCIECKQEQENKEKVEAQAG